MNIHYLFGLSSQYSKPQEVINSISEFANSMKMFTENDTLSIKATDMFEEPEKMFDLL